MKALIATGAVLLGLLPGAAHAWVIAPGALASFPFGNCTLNFVFDGTDGAAGRVFIGSAAHCASGPEPGDEVRMGTGLASEGEVIGHVVAMGAYTSPNGPPVVEEDWVLVEVLPRLEKAVDPAVVGHPTFPTRVTLASEMAAGDVLQFSGHGSATSATAETRERRQGEWVGGDEVTGYDAFAPLASHGDSGGPIVDVKTGGALGVMSTVFRGSCGSTCTLEGPTIGQLLRGAAARGLPVRLRAAGEQAPALAPPAPAPVASDPPSPAPHAAPVPAEPRLTLRGCVRRGRLTLRVQASVPLASARLTAPRRRALPLDRPVRLRVRGRRVRVTVAAVARDGERLTARRRFASC